MIDLTVLATVVANTVKCRSKQLLIVASEKTAFLELVNPLNSDVGFQVDTGYFHLNAFPIRGIIPARKNMTVTITFKPEVGFAPIKEIEVLSDSGTKELVEVSTVRQCKVKQKKNRRRFKLGSNMTKNLLDGLPISLSTL